MEFVLRLTSTYFILRKISQSCTISTYSKKLKFISHNFTYTFFFLFYQINLQLIVLFKIALKNYANNVFAINILLCNWLLLKTIEKNDSHLSKSKSFHIYFIYYYPVQFHYVNLLPRVINIFDMVIFFTLLFP